jgi:hypothetical protein
MIKVYLDWNVMSGMKNNYFKDLIDLFLPRNDKFMLVYSTSHITDISSSKKNEDISEDNLITNDLEFISLLTDNWCLYNNTNNIVLNKCSPQEIYNERIDDTELFTDFSIDKLFSGITENDTDYPLIKPYIDLLKSLPLDPIFKQVLQDPVQAELLNKFLPGLKDKLTMEGFFESFGQMYYNLNETEAYKDLRLLVQNVGVNSSHYNETKNPFELINKAYKKHGLDNFSINQYFDNSKNAPKWYNDITNEYLMLDLHGYKADKVKVTDKEKNTFRNTTEDANHSAFASMCDFYITNDDKNYHKTKAVYNKLNIRTIVVKPQEFIYYFDKYLNFSGYTEHFSSIIHTIKNEPIFQEQLYSNGDRFGDIGLSKMFYFDFFNKILIPDKIEENLFSFILGKETPSNTFIISYKEIANLVKFFTDLFGTDDNGKELLEINELKDNLTWDGRIWTTSEGEFYITYLNSRFLMYFNYFIDNSKI